MSDSSSYIPNFQSQNAMILAALKAGRAVTPLDALTEFSCFRLAARIWELRSAGYDIHTARRTNGRKQWAEYRLISSGGARR